MCIIAYKPKNEKFPSDKRMRAMFRNNPDGAGFMYADGGAVVIKKGFMEYSDFRREYVKISSRRDLAVVFHFRIATHGGINRAMCQPFPLSTKTKRLKSLDTRAGVGIAHNGIIPMTCDARDISDTALFIKKYMPRITCDGTKFDAVTLDIIEQCIDSRMVILESDGAAHVIGKGWKCDAGVWYSNTSYETRSKLSYSAKKRAASIYTPYSDYTRGYDDAGAYTYDYGDSGVYGDICGGDCSICQWLDYCYGTDSDLAKLSGAREV